MKTFYAFLLLLIITSTLKAQEIGFKWLRNIQHEMVRPYSDNLAAFMQNGKWGFMDTQGDVVITPKYEETGNFNNGIVRAKLNGMWGVINKADEPIFDFVFSELEEFSEGFALAKEGENYFYITPNQKRIALSNELEYYSFREGLARIKNKSKGKWGFINKKGLFEIEPRYTSASDFSGGCALVSNHRDTFYISPKERKKTSSLKTLQPLVFKEGRAKVKVGEETKFINQDMEFLPISVLDAGDYSEGVAAILQHDNSMAYLNLHGAIAMRLDYDKVGQFSEGKAWVCRNEKYGYINHGGELIIDTIFSSATDFKDGIAYVSAGQRLGMIKLKEETDIFPNLELKEMTLKDLNNNNQVEAEEDFELTVTLQNNGGEPLYDINVTMAGNLEQQEWFNFEQMNIQCDSLAAGAETVIKFKGQAKLELHSEDIKLQFRGIADNLYSPVQESFQFTSMGINACKPSLARYWVYKDDHTPLQVGDEGNLKIIISNNGKDLAKAVKVDLIWAKGISGSSNLLEIPILKPGESKEISTTFILDSVTTENNFTIVANLSEYTKKHKEIKYLNFEVGKMNAEINLETSAPIMFQIPEINQQTLAANTISTPQAAVVKNQKINDSELLDGIKLASTPNINKYALVIGNEDYNSFKQTVSYEVNVDFATHDATAFAAYATHYLGVPKQNVILLKNATYAQMNFNLNKLLMMSKTNPDKVELYVYYAGHGQHDINSKETYLIPVDVSISTPTAGLKLERIYADLSNCNSKRTMVFLDACYSGVGRGIVIKSKKTIVNGNLLVFTASSSSQRSMPYMEKRHGIFTYFLLNTLKEVEGQISVEDLYQRVKDNVQKNSIWINNVEQTPELIKGAGIEENWESWTLD